MQKEAGFAASAKQEDLQDRPFLDDDGSVDVAVVDNFIPSNIIGTSLNVAAQPHDLGEPDKAGTGQESYIPSQLAYIWRLLPSEGAGSAEFCGEFEKRVGMLPQRVFRIILLYAVLYGWAMVLFAAGSLEYMRYYVSNSITKLAVIGYIGGAPVFAIRALFYPFLASVADRLERKKVLVATGTFHVIAACLLAFFPNVSAAIAVRFLGIFDGVHYAAMFALLRDLFPQGRWEYGSGGYTSILAKMAQVLLAFIAIGGGVGMGIIKLNNEYQANKNACSEDHCVPEGQFSMYGFWEIDGGLRVLGLLSALLTLLAFLLLVFLVPETKAPYDNDQESFFVFCREEWKKLRKPWQALQVFSTRRLRYLIWIDFVDMIVGASTSSCFAAWYRKTEPSQFNMGILAACASVGAFIGVSVTPRVVSRFGDMSAVWIPAHIVQALLFLFVIVLAPLQWYSMIPVAFILCGPQLALYGIRSALFSKLFPANVQLHWRLARGFLMNAQGAVNVWIFVGLLALSETFPSPWDMLSVFVSFSLSIFSLCLTTFVCFTPELNPKEDIDSGNALSDFYRSAYAQKESINESRCRSLRAAANPNHAQNCEIVDLSHPEQGGCIIGQSAL